MRGDMAEDLLANSEFFAEVDEDLRAQIAALGQRRRMVRGDVLFAEGDDPSELFIVLEGELSFQSSRGWIAAPQGSVVFAPRNAPHTFRNNGSTPSRHVVIAMPSGFDEFYARCADVFAAGGPPDIAQLRAIADE